MKASTAAFWLLIVLIVITAIVAIFSMTHSSDNNLEIMKRFFDIMQYVITLVGGGYLGTQIGEKYPNEGKK